MATAKQKIGFIGLGSMGDPMAALLIKAGYPVTVFDVRAPRVAEFVSAHGGSGASKLDELGQCDVILTILPTSAIVEDVFFGANGLASKLRGGTVVADMTSGVPAMTVSLHERLAKQDIFFFDAPVSGGVTRATSGELSIMIGGEDKKIDSVMPILQTMGTQITKTGGIGSGHAMKALNNLVSAGGFLIGIEALMIGSRFGLDVDTMVDVLNASTGMNNSTQKKFKQFVLSRKFNSGFPLALMVKDLTIALGIAHDEKVNAPFAGVCRDLWAGASSLLGPVDHTAVAKMSEAFAGFEIGEAKEKR